MADRTVAVRLSAEVSGYIQGMDQAARKTREMGSEAEKLAQKRQAFQTLGASALTAGLAIAAGIGFAVARFAEFDQAMSNANAILQETTAGQNALRDAALEAGGATVFTATESANAIEELGKAGISTADILSGALTGSLDLAASGQLGVARAAEITGITLKQFQLDGTQAARVADVLSAGANKAVGSVDDLANGLKFVGPVAAGMNVSLEDTVATLTLFSDRGVLGEQAGTSLRGMLASLTSPSTQARKELERLNVTLYDGNGRFLGMENAAGELNRALASVTDAERDMALGMIFGNQQVTTARILVDAGADTWREYRESVDDSGIAARIAAERMDNLAGDIEKLGGAFDTALIQTGSGANDVLRGIVQTLTFLVDSIGELPEPVLYAGLAVGVLVGAVGLVGGAALLAVPKIAEFKAAVSAAGISVGAAASRMALLSGAVVAATLVLGAIAAAQAEHSAQVDTYASTLDSATGRITISTREMAKEALAAGNGFAWLWGDFSGQSAYDAAGKLGLSLETVTEAALGNKDAIEELRVATADWGDDVEQRAALAEELGMSERDLAHAIDAVSNGINAQTTAIEEARKRTEQKAEADGRATESSEELEAATSALREQILETNAALVDVRGAYDAAVQKNIDLAQSTADATRSSKDSWEDYYDGVSVTVADYLAELQKMVDAQTDWESNMIQLAGRVSQETLDELARMGPEGAPLVASLVNASDEELARMEALFGQRAEAATGEFANRLELSQELIALATAQLGQKAADEITEKLASGSATIPEIIAQYNLNLENNPLLVQANAAAARAEVEKFIASYDNRKIKIGVSAETIVGNPSMGYVNSNAMGGMYSGGVQAFANGGFPSGIYGYRPGGIHKFAEAGDEAYISFLPQYRERNIGIWRESGNRLGVQPPTAVPAPQNIQVDMHVSSSDPYATGELVKQQLAAKLVALG